MTPPMTPPMSRVITPVTRSARQSGVALITAMLVVALVGILASAVLDEQLLTFRRSENLAASEQAYRYARGLEDWAAKILHEDRQESDLDAASENWASQLPVLPVEGGRLTGRLRALDGRINLNDLVTPAGAERPERVERLRRLLQALELDPRIADAVLDWLDQDIRTRDGGAEDLRYMGGTPAYRAANRDFAHRSELRFVAGVGADAYRRLEPHVVALPRGASLNINLATVPVFRSLHERIDSQLAERLAERAEEGFQSVDELSEVPALREVPLNTAGLAVRSRYFQAHGIVEMARTAYHFYSLIERAGADFRVLRRSIGVD